jgi:hypothetical protein
MRLIVMFVLLGALVGLCGCGEDASWLVVVNTTGGNIVVDVNAASPDSSAAPPPGTCRP